MSQEHWVSVDIETAGSGTNAALWSIGACDFDPQTGKILKRFYRNIDLQSSLDSGGVVNGKTMEWWMQQSDEARLALFKDPVSLYDALKAFHEWFPEGGKVWGNGSNFDNRIIRESYDRLGCGCPFHYRADMDLRTLHRMQKFLGTPKPQVERIGVHHNALDDAEFQANLIFALVKSIRGAMLP
jgi:hypothetical protein